MVFFSYIFSEHDFSQVTCVEISWKFFSKNIGSRYVFDEIFEKFRSVDFVQWTQIFVPQWKKNFRESMRNFRRPPAKILVNYEMCFPWSRGGTLKVWYNFLHFSPRKNFFTENKTLKNRYWVSDIKVGDCLRVSKNMLFIQKIRSPRIMIEITPKVYGVMSDTKRI